MTSFNPHQPQLFRRIIYMKIETISVNASKCFIHLTLLDLAQFIVLSFLSSLNSCISTSESFE